MSFLCFFFFFLTLLLSYAPFSVSYTVSSFYHRRLLHQPFFPLENSPPSQPPLSPLSHPLPKFPLSTIAPPFFPFYPSSPPPPRGAASTLATFPANISSLILPNTPSSKPKTSKIVIAVVLPLLAVSILAVFAFFLYRRRRHGFIEKTTPSDGHRLFPADAPSSSDRHKASVSGTESDFLYFGGAESSRRIDGEVHSGTPTGQNSPYRKLGSPELQPLPPLPRQFHKNRGNATGLGSDEDEEEFFSPRGSSGGKESPSVRTLQLETAKAAAAAAEKCSNRSWNSGSPSCQSSKSASPIPSSHSNSNGTSPSASFSSSVQKIKPPNLAFPMPSLHLNSPSPSASLSSSVPRIKSPDSASISQSTGSKSLSPPAGISPERPETKFPKSLTNLVGSEIAGFMQPPWLQHPQSIIPSPPDRKSPSPPEPCLPWEKELDKNTVPVERIPCVPALNEQPQAENVNFLKHLHHNPPPPPPPPPPPGFWDRLFPPLAPDPPMLEHPAHVSPSITVELKNQMAVSPPELLENSNAVESNSDHTRPKLKPLHWDKVRASSDRAMVWDQLKTSSFQLNEEMIETLFICNATNSVPKEATNRPVLPWANQENRVLDPKRSQNVAILLRALNVTKEEVCEGLLEGNTDTLGTELLETLLKMAPTKEEELKLKEYKDDPPFKLGPAEKFLKAVLGIPFAFKRVDAMLYIANFDSEVNYLKKSFETLEAACEELRSSRMFLKLLEAVLKTGNRMNVGTNRGDAEAFKLDTLLKLVDIKGTDGKTTLLHFVVQEITRYEGSRLSGTNQFPTYTKNHQPDVRDDVEFRKRGLQVVSGLSGELSSVKKAAAMDSDVLSSYVSKLAGGIGKIAEVARLNDTASLKDSNKFFSQAMNEFLKKAEEQIIKIQALESATLTLVREITEYFHGNSAKEEAHPFRIFMVVRDFLSTLDQVCKEVGKINERKIISSARQFPAIANPFLPPVFPGLNVRQPDSSDDDNSSLSP